MERSPKALVEHYADGLRSAFALALIAVSIGCTERATGSPEASRATRAATSSLPPLWEAAEDMSVPRQFHAAAKLDATHVLVCGGRKNLTDTATFYDSCETFDATTKQFQAAAALTDPAIFLSLVSIEPGRVLAIGGSNRVSSGTSYLATVSSFQRSSGTGAWSPLTALPGARDHQLAAWLPASSTVAVVGGFNGTTTLNDVVAQLQDSGDLGAWRTVSPASARFGHTATVLSGGASLLVAGGRTTSDLNSSVRRLAVAANGTGTWTELAPLPSALGSHIAALEPSGERVLIAGGQHTPTSATADAGYYDPAESGSFTAVAPMTTARWTHAAAWLQGKLIVTGGLGADFELTASVEFYDPAQNQWFPLDAMSLPRREHTLTVLDDRSLLVAGGTAVLEGSQATASAEVLTPRLLGESCDATHHECLTGYCTDGVCCAEACAGSCQRCDASGTCRKNVSGEPVGDRSCEGGLVCKTGACLTSCSKHEDCMSDRYCDDGQCLPRKAQGSECTVERECADGAPCVDGFCCESACDDICASCGEPEWKGTCVAVSGVPVGDRGSCGEPSDECGLTCNGKDRTACHYQKAKTTCGQAHCADGEEEGLSTCDGHGNCTDNTSDCGVFACTTEGRCGTECASNDDCRDNRYKCLPDAMPATCVPKDDVGKDCKTNDDCSEGLVCDDAVCCETDCPDSGWSCALENHRGDCRKVLGTACESDQECGSELCVDGVCCNAACEGQCEYCNVEERPGQCSAVRGPAPPRREPCQAGTELCDARSCDGVDSAVSRSSCQGYANVDVACAPADCGDDNAFHAERYCSTDGTCRATTPHDCGAYVCAETGCLTTCKSDDDCSAGNQCLNGSCGPPAAHCEGDSLVLASGATEDCEGFRCVGNACLTTCKTSAQCVNGFVCDDRQGVCVSATTSASDSGCSCSVPGEPARRADPRWLLGLLFGLAWQRRRRALGQRKSS